MAKSTMTDAAAKGRTAAWSTPIAIGVVRHFGGASTTGFESRVHLSEAVADCFNRTDWEPAV